MAIKTNAEMAEMYQDAIAKLVSGGVASYTIAGRTFTKLNIAELEKGFRYYQDRAAEDKFGGRFVTYSDLRGLP